MALRRAHVFPLGATVPTWPRSGHLFQRGAPLRRRHAGAALVVVVGAIVWSKKETLSMEDIESGAPAVLPLVLAVTS